ncbi:dipeptide/oligopeptide/nickel ABC transporter permease [Halovivax asiaticus JCM 14624]|uniref:Dipeptide/oligopeptide/nickel ABC transporter permease n=1 Tax=Halovivax asiaticus JCM 14624 TaxID=1227490 RepID=M0BTL1_9EURY|nr:ABC transporter permease [Halovivax asiaticus]ELZ14295.1 dipeptide/oligopeptide/nickel ABC transporter permease [Halovivax asiaticus JCM 14624]
MRQTTLVLKQLGLAVTAVWAVVTAVFVLFTVTSDFMMPRAGARPPGLTGEGSFWQQYVDWLIRMFTLDWGGAQGGGPAVNEYVYTPGEPVLPLVLNALWRTMQYVGPAILLAILLGIAIGLFAAIRPRSRVANGGVVATYVLFAIPNFWIGGMLLSYSISGRIPYSSFLFKHVIPVALIAVTLTGSYVSYARAQSLEYVTSDFVKLVRAKGATRVRVARHVLANAAIPLLSMLFTEALGLLVLSVFVVEVLFGIEGLGLLVFGAANSKDVPVLLGCVIVIVFLGVCANALQDFAYRALDPRVDTGRR